MVWRCRLGVEAYASLGRQVEVPRLRCAECQRPLIFWPGYSRFVRVGVGCVRIWVRRGKCRECGITHALLPAFALVRRLDLVAVIGDALARMIQGKGARSLAVERSLPPSTVRGWRRRHRARAPDWLNEAERLLVEWGADLVRRPADVEQAAVAALVEAWRRAVSRAAGDAPPGVWEFTSVITGGAWLGTTTSARLGKR